MKKISMIATILLASSVFAKECLVEVNNLEVRKLPNKKSKVIARLQAGSVVKITDEKNGWYEVSIGWISKKYCTVFRDKKQKQQIKRAISLGQILPKNKTSQGFYPQIVNTMFSYVAVSLTDVSRITCPSEIKWFTYSKEKEIQIQKAGKNLLVKISPKVILENGKTKEIKRGTFPRELLVECEEQVFTLILLPKKVPTQTIVLKPLLEDKKKALKFETSNPYEETIKTLIRKVYKEQPIDGYELRLVNRPYKRFKRLNMDLKRIYEGSYYRIEEYKLTAKENIDLHERLFIPHLKNPLAIALSKLSLKKGETGRLFVVSKQEDE